MSENQNPKEFYEKLKVQLFETSDWPSKYLYKFIVKTDVDKINEIEMIFNNMGAVINKTVSKNEKYTSVSIHVQMENPESVIAKYIKVAENIEGVISL